ncbi:hypothetical protein Srufu_036420 [Streptomyces libani subsp. rufus]|nr:hypothetical protein Srufu_036420 [Streptomyces libani subsp. rufus]
MLCWYGRHGGGWAWLAMSISIFLFLALLFVIALLIVRALGHAAPPAASPRRTAADRTPNRSSRSGTPAVRSTRRSTAADWPRSGGRRRMGRRRVGRRRVERRLEHSAAGA